MRNFDELEHCSMFITNYRFSSAISHQDHSITTYFVSSASETASHPLTIHHRRGFMFLAHVMHSNR